MMDKIITIKAKANASRRTKNRIRGFGPLFIVEKKHDPNDIIALIGKRDSESWLSVSYTHLTLPTTPYV